MIYCWFGADDLRIYRENDAFTTAYIAVSANVAWYAAECMNLPEDKIIIIENGINPAGFNHSPTARENFRNTHGISGDEFLFLNPASIYGPKGQINLIRAFANAHKVNPKLRLLIAGKVLEEPYFKDIQKVIDENNLKDAVIAGKYFDNMSDVYNAADAVVLSSLHDSLTASQLVLLGDTGSAQALGRSAASDDDGLVAGDLLSGSGGVEGVVGSTGLLHQSVQHGNVSGLTNGGDQNGAGDVLLAEGAVLGSDLVVSAGAPDVLALSGSGLGSGGGGGSRGAGGGGGSGGSLLLGTASGQRQQQDCCKQQRKIFFHNHTSVI